MYWFSYGEFFVVSGEYAVYWGRLVKRKKERERKCIRFSFKSTGLDFACIVYNYSALRWDIRCWVKSGISM